MSQIDPFCPRRTSAPKSNVSIICLFHPIGNTNIGGASKCVRRRRRPPRNTRPRSRNPAEQPLAPAQSRSILNLLRLAIRYRYARDMPDDLAISETTPLQRQCQYSKNSRSTVAAACSRAISRALRKSDT